ncbi:MAG: helix-turn-helix transcriptional regulator [Erysipelotrichaceae bacterium]
MLNENIKTIRKSKGLSQEELAIKLNVVRQTISKWEKGLSVPDSEMLVDISEIFEMPVSTLLGETIVSEREDELKVIAEKLEIINLQLSQTRINKQKMIRWILIFLCTLIVGIFAGLSFINSPYLAWNSTSQETTVLKVGFQSIEWLFVRVAPIILIGGMIAIIFTYKNK